MLGSKDPNYDAYGLFRASALLQSSPIFAYRGIIIPLLCSYRGGSQGLSSTYEQAHVDLDLLTLASSKIYIKESLKIVSVNEKKRRCDFMCTKNDLNYILKK